MAENLSAPEQESGQVENPENGAGRVMSYRGVFPSAVDLLVFFGIYFVAMVVGMLTAVVVGIPAPDAELLKSADEIVVHDAQVALGHYNALTFLVTMSLTLAGFLLYRNRRRGPGVVAHFSARGLNPILLLWGVILILASSVVLEPLMQLLPEVPNVYGRGFWTLMTVMVMAPLFEETIFRGVLLESVRARYGAVAALLIPAVMFGVIHIHPALVLNATVMGLVLGFIYLRSDSLWSTIILHAINNGIAYLLLLCGVQNLQLNELIASPTLYTVVYIVALVVFGASGYMVYRVLGRLSMERKNETSV